MGDFSRDTFKLTNVMHQLLTRETVTNPRHYVGVRLQQGVPVLDSDWNEQEDIISADERLKLQHFFGNGIPSGNDGFHVGPVTKDNDFAINAGIALVDGMVVVNQHTVLTYQSQATNLGVSVDMLSAPTVGMRDDLVYLDVWEEEVTTSDAERRDSRLTNPIIGVETCTRIERRWVVRVKADATSFDTVETEEGHAYMVLAVLKRIEKQDSIEPNRIEDLRCTDLNVAKYLKVPVYAKRSTDIVDSQRLSELLDNLRQIFLDRIKDETLYIPTEGISARLLYFAISQITQVCSTGAMQARTNNLTNSDALEVLLIVQGAQDDFLEMLENRGDGSGDMTKFINTYRIYLEGDTNVVGIVRPLAEGDLIGAYKGQQTLNAWLSAPGGTLPEGDVLIQYLSIEPQPTPEDGLQAGIKYTITVEFSSRVTSDQDSETFDVKAVLSSALWELVDPVPFEIQLDNEGGTGTLEFVLVPNAANTSCALLVTAEARRNPVGVKSPENELLLEIGSVPAIGGILQFAGIVDEFGRVRLNSTLLNASMAGVPFSLNNRTDEEHYYTLNYRLTLQSGDLREVDRIIAVSAQSTETVTLFFNSPDGIEVTVDDEGTIEVTLTKIDELPDLPAEEQESVTKSFIVI